MRKHKPIVFDSLEKPTIWNFRDLTGQRFHRLTVIGFAGMRRKRSHWHCRCDCGGESILPADTLNGGQTKSCGCLQAAITVKRNRTDMVVHGESSKPSPEYSVWCCMKRRCDNPTNHKYPLYGGMGVKVCERWSKSFAAFLADMGRRPSRKHTIDRWPDCWGDYEPNNCRWATYLEQRHNRRDSAPRKEHAHG